MMFLIAARKKTYEAAKAKLTFRLFAPSFALDLGCPASDYNRLAVEFTEAANKLEEEGYTVVQFIPLQYDDMPR